MPIHKLTLRKAATAGPGKHEDGGGLWLVVSRTGAWKWMLRFTLHGKRREMGLGSFADVEADQTSRAHLHCLCRPLCGEVQAGTEGTELDRSHGVSLPEPAEAVWVGPESWHGACRPEFGAYIHS